MAKKRNAHKLIAAGTTMLVAEPALALMHTGGIGAIAGLGLAAIAYTAMSEFEQETGREISLPVLNRFQRTATPGKPSLAYRLLNGKSTRAQEGDEDDDPDTDELYEDWNEESEEIPAWIVLAHNLVLCPNDLIGKAIFGVGQRRSGKTTLMARIAEQIGYQYIPMIIPNSEGDLLSLYQILPRSIIAAAPGYYDHDHTRLWEVTSEDAGALGYQILAEGLQVILDFASFRDSTDAWAIMVGVIDGLFQFAHQHPDEQCPVEVFLDEAQKYLPQDISVSQVKDELVRDDLLQAYANCLTDGGKWGITPVIFSQRFAETNNKIMAQAQVRFVMRQTGDNDLDRVKKHVNKEVATSADIYNFQQGEGVYIGDDGGQLRTQFYPRESDGSRSHTPQAEAAARYRNRPLDNIQRTLPTTPNPARLETQHQRPTEDIPPRQPRQRKESPVERAAQAYLDLKDAGKKYSQPAIAAATHIDLWDIRKMWPAILEEVERLEADAIVLVEEPEEQA